jgi:serum amyloid A protein
VVSEFVAFTLPSTYVEMDANNELWKNILDNTIKIPIDFVKGANDFQKNYSDMRRANWKNSDKYFHAKANFQAAHHGPGGILFAIFFSNIREMWDQNVKGYPSFDSELDQSANQFGREKAKQYESNDFRKALWIYRPSGLPSKY